MFEGLTSRLNNIQARIRQKGRLKPKDVDEILDEILSALVDADVNLDVARDFIERVKTAAIGSDIHSSLNATQQVVKILNEELTNLLGGEAAELNLGAKPPVTILMVGLQGTGKTTTAVKLASWLKQQNRRPLLVGADLHRPSAIEQLQVLAKDEDIPVFSEGKTPKAIASNSLKAAKKAGRDVVICDTAGRTSIDSELMAEISQIEKILSPQHTLLVVDSMSGQDSLSVSQDFSSALPISGLILTKLDGDARGGAALSAREVVGQPIYFASTGERLQDFEVFHPDRLASRILGMGDMLTLIEKTEQVYEEEELKQAEEKVEKMLAGQVTLDDFLEQMRMVQKLGMEDVLQRLPANQEVGDINIEETEKKFIKMEAMISSMTSEEKMNPEIIDSSRRKRIANGSGVTPTDVSALIRDFLGMRKEMKKLGGLQKLKSRMGM